MNPNSDMMGSTGVSPVPVGVPPTGSGSSDVTHLTDLTNLTHSSPSDPSGSASQSPTLSLSPAIRAQLGIAVTPDSADPDLLHIRASDATLDRYKEVIVASGWRLENYLRNPVIQNAHQYGDIIFTIGRAEKTWVSGNALLQTWRFASNENPFAKIARDLYRGKFLQAASVGFLPLKWEDPTSDHGGASYASPNMAGTQVPRRRYLEQELLEVSAVGIPANPNALTLALKAGAIEHSDLRELFQLLKHLLRSADAPSDLDCGGSTPPSIPKFGVPPSGGPVSPIPSHLAELLPSLRFLRSLLFQNSTSNHKSQ